MHIFGESLKQLNGETYLFGVDLLSLVQCYEDCWHDSGFFFFFLAERLKRARHQRLHKL